MAQIIYKDKDGQKATIDGLDIYTDKNGKVWIWSELTESNLAIKEYSELDALKSALSSLLFILQLKNERIEKLAKIAEYANEFADKLKEVE